MRRAWFAIVFCTFGACQLDSHTPETSGSDIKPSASHDLGKGPIRDYLPDAVDAGVREAQPQAGAGERVVGAAAVVAGRAAAGAQAIATPAAHGIAGASGMTSAAGGAGKPSVAGAAAAVGGAGAMGDPTPEAVGGTSGQTVPPDDAMPDAGSTPPPVMPVDAAVPVDAATPPAKDAAASPDAAQVAADGGSRDDDHVLRDALRLALVQLLLNLGNDDALAPDLAAVVALVIADGALTPQLLATALNAVANADACQQDTESQNVCAATCAGLAVQCKECAQNKACRNALQRVCGQQIRVDRCQ